MAIIKYRVKSRGRPREIDTNLIYQEIVEATKKALPRLEEIRQSTKGYRGEDALTIAQKAISPPDKSDKF